MENQQEIDILLEFCKEQWERARHVEAQQATITNYLLTFTVALIAFSTVQPLEITSLPVGLLLAITGIFGVVITRKYYERFISHHRRTILWQERIDSLCPNAHLLRLKDEADNLQAQEFPQMYRLRGNKLWTLIHGGIAIGGASYSVILIIIHFNVV